jgi:hypothetical protein
VGARPQAGAASDQEDTERDRQDTRQAEQAEPLVEQQHGGEGGDQRAGAARDRVHDRQVRLAVTLEQHVEVQQVRDGAGDDEGPLGESPARHRVPAGPQPDRCPDERDQQRTHEHEAVVAAGLLRGDVPQCMQQRGNQHQGECKRRHAQALSTPPPALQSRA